MLSFLEVRGIIAVSHRLPAAPGWLPYHFPAHINSFSLATGRAHQVRCQVLTLYMLPTRRREGLTVELVVLDLRSVSVEI